VPTTAGGKEKTVYRLTVEAFTRWCQIAPNKEVGDAANKFMVECALATSSVAPQVVQLVTNPITRALDTTQARPHELTAQLQFLQDMDTAKAMLALDVVERQQNLEAQKRKEHLQHVVDMVDLYTKLNYDDKDRVQLRQYITSTMLMPVITAANPNPTNTALTVPAQPIPQRARPISLSSWLHETRRKRMGTQELLVFGTKVAAMYRLRHNGKSPSKHDQLVNGRVTQVNSYITDDIPLLEQVYRAHISP
jgi:hypothetical protein